MFIFNFLSFKNHFWRKISWSSTSSIPFDSKKLWQDIQGTDSTLAGSAYHCKNFLCVCGVFFLGPFSYFCNCCFRGAKEHGKVSLQPAVVAQEIWGTYRKCVCTVFGCQVYFKSCLRRSSTTAVTGRRLTKPSDLSAKQKLRYAMVKTNLRFYFKAVLSSLEVAFTCSAFFRSVVSTGDLECSVAGSTAHITVTTGRGQVLVGIRWPLGGVCEQSLCQTKVTSLPSVALTFCLSVSTRWQTMCFSEATKDQINFDLLDDVALCRVQELSVSECRLGVLGFLIFERG